MASDGMNASTAATVLPAAQASKRFLMGDEPEFATLKMVRRRLWQWQEPKDECMCGRIAGRISRAPARKRHKM